MGAAPHSLLQLPRPSLGLHSPARPGPTLPEGRGPILGPIHGRGLGTRRALPEGQRQTFFPAFDERAAPALASQRRTERCPAELSGTSPAGAEANGARPWAGSDPGRTGTGLAQRLHRGRARTH